LAAPGFLLTAAEQGRATMAFRPNYRQQRGDRDRAKEQKKQERLQRRTEDAERRKAERDGLLRRQPGEEHPAADSPESE
jgi:hypothetical protein